MVRCFLEFVAGTIQFTQQLRWDGKAYRATPMPPAPPTGAAWRFWRIRVEDDTRTFELTGTEVEWTEEIDPNLSVGKDQLRQHVQQLACGPLRLSAVAERVRLWIRVPNTLVPLQDSRVASRSGDYLLVQFVLWARLNQPLTINAVAGREATAQESDYRSWGGAHPGEVQPEKRLVLTPASGGPPLNERCVVDHWFGTCAAGTPLTADWIGRTVNGRETWNLRLQRELAGANEYCLRTAARVTFEQRQLPGALAAHGSTWSLAAAVLHGADASGTGLRREASVLAWRQMLRTLVGRPRSERTGVFELEFTTSDVAWLPRWHLRVDAPGFANHDHTFHATQQAPTWSGSVDATLSFPGLQDWTLAPLRAKAQVAATAPTSTRTELLISGLQVPTPQAIRMGAFDLVLHGRTVVLQPCACELEFEPVLEPTSGPHSLTRLVLSGYRVGTPSGRLRLPVRDLRPGGSDLDERRNDESPPPPPLLVPIGEPPRMAGDFEPIAELLVEESREPSGARGLQLRLVARAENAPTQLQTQRLLYLDRAPFTVAMIRMPEIRSFDRAGGVEIAYWSDADLFAGWQLRAAAAGFDLILPPQGVGEGMEKSRAGQGSPDIAEGERVDFLFPPPAVLGLTATDLPRRYAGAPWNLRLLLAELREHRLTGVQLTTAHFELLYGLRATLRDLPWLRLSELWARLGEPRGALPAAVPAEFRAKLAQGTADLGYGDARRGWAALAASVAERLAVHEVFDDRQTEFTATGEALGLQLTGQRGRPGLAYELRSSAKFANPIAGAPRLAVGVPEFLDGLTGGFAWAFESQKIWEALWRDGAGKDVSFVDGALSRLFFTALGGSGVQQASFDEGRTIIAARVELGRVVELRVERLGRLAVFWNKVKLVTVFSRTVLPTTQFRDQQDPHHGRAILRKTEEYLEFLERRRAFPDASVEPGRGSAPDCLIACSAEARILVDSRHGRDFTRGEHQGFLVPLRTPFGNAAVYGPVDVRLHFRADPDSGTEETVATIGNATDLWFWSDTAAGRGPDSDRWPPVPGVDSGDFGHLHEARHLAGADPTGAAAVAGRSARFTWRLDGLPQPVSLVSPGAPTPPDAPRISSRLSSITIARGEAIANEPATTNSPLDDFRAEVDSVLDVVERLTTRHLQGATLPIGTFGALQKVFGAADGPLARAGRALDGLGRIEPTALGNRICRQLGDRVRWVARRASDGLAGYAARLSTALATPLAAIGSAIDDSADATQAAVGAAKNALQRFWRAGLAAADGLAQAMLARVRSLADAVDDLATAVATLRRFVQDFDPQTPVAALLAEVNRVALPWLVRMEQFGDELAALPWFAGLPTRVDPRPMLLELRRLAARVRSLATTAVDIAKVECLHVLGDLQRQLDTAQAQLATTEAELADLLAGVDDPLAEIHAELQGGLDQIVAKLQVGTDAARQQLVEVQQRLLTVAADLAAGLDAVADRLAELAEQRCEALLGSARDLITGVVDQGKDLLRRLASGVQELGTAAADQARSWFEQQRQVFGGHLAAVPAALRDAVSDASPVAQVPARALTLFRAFGEVPAAAGLDFDEIARLDREVGVGDLLRVANRRLRSIAYGFDRRAAEVLFTPVRAVLDRARDAVGDVVQEARLKAASLQMPVRAFRDRLLADVDALRQRALGDLIPDFGGLKLERLLGGVVGTELANRIAAATRLRHAFDRQSMTATVEAEIDDFALGRNATLFAFGPVAFTLRRPRLAARLSLTAPVGGGVRTRSSGSITADWEMAVGGRPLLTFRDAALRCDDGALRMDLDPSRLELDGVLRSLSDLLRNFRTGDQGISAGIDADLPRSVVGYCRVAMGLPPVQAGAFAITNLDFGAFLEAGVEFAPTPRFLIRTGCNLASRQAPFAIIVFVLGGCGWFSLVADYRVPLVRGPSELTVRVDAAIGAAASIGVNLGIAQGSVFASLALEVSCTVRNGAHRWGLAVVLTFGGRVRVLGIIDVAIEIVLAVRYESGGGLTGEGHLSISIRICWCIKINVRAGFTYRFGRAQTSSSSSVGVSGPAPELAAPAGSSPVRTAATSVAGPGATSTVRTQARRQRLQRAAAANA